MTDRTITADEFHRSIEGLRQYVGQRCDGLDARLDKVNGRLDRHGHAIGQLTPEVARNTVRLDAIDRVAAADQPPVSPELRELLDAARDAKGALRVTRWLWAIGAALLPLVLWWLSLQKP